jgi:hypothetical protein
MLVLQISQYNKVYFWFVCNVSNKKALIIFAMSVYLSMCNNFRTVECISMKSYIELYILYWRSNLVLHVQKSDHVGKK